MECKGQGDLKKMTHGYELLVRFKEIMLEWINIKDLKVSNAVGVTEYVV